MDPVADLAVVKTASSAFIPDGGTVVFTIEVTNAGPSSVTGSVLTDGIVLGLSKTNVACSTLVGNRCVDAPSIAELEAGFELPSIAVGENYSLEVTVVADAETGIYTNIATIEPPDGTRDPDPTNDTSQADVQVGIVEANFVLVKRNEATVVRPGGATTYKITVTNEGPTTVPGATLLDPVMPGLTKTSVNCASSPDNQCAAGPSIAEIESGLGAQIATLAAGQFYEIDVVAIVDVDAGTVTNTATVYLPEGYEDPTPDNHTDAVTTPVDADDLPATGSDSGSLVVLALALMAAGALLVAVRGSRHRWNVPRT